MPQLVETEHEWIARHQATGPGIRLGDAIVYGDGAVQRDRGGVYEPPEDQWENLALRIRRHKELLRRAAEKFIKARQFMLETCTAGRRYQNIAPHTEKDLEELRRLRDEAERLRSELDTLDAEWQGSPDAQFRKRLAEQELARQAAITDMEKLILET